MQKALTCLLFLVLNLRISAQQSTVSGFVYDSQSHERLISASVVVIGSRTGCISNEQGYFSLVVDRGKVEIKVSFVGYSPDTIYLNNKRDTVITCFLKSNITLNNVFIVGQTSPMSYNGTKVQASELARLPVLASEPDIMKSLQLLPGVQSTSEGQAGFSVKGGDNYQNLVLLDGVPVYNSSHLFGFFSIFHEKAIQGMTMYKGDFPAQYGGCLSSIVDIQTKEGNANHFTGSGSVGLLAASACLEGPIGNSKTTFFLSGRQSYLNLLVTPLIKYFSNDGSSSYGFYDINTKITHRFNDKNKLSFSFYRSNDSESSTSSDASAYFNEQQAASWGNLLGSFTWSHVINSKLFLNTIVHYSNYNYSSKDSYGQNFNTSYATSENNYQSTINDKGIHSDLTWFRSPVVTIRAGMAFTFQKYIPGVESSYNSNITSTGDPVQLENVTGNRINRSNQLDVYAGGDFHLSKNLSLNAGVRYTAYKNDVLYSNPEPRLNLEYYLGKEKFSFACTMVHQYNHLLTTSQLSQATDLWVPSARGIKPEQSVQYSLNAEHAMDAGYSISAELYCKTFQHLLAYQDGASFINSTSWQDMVTTGIGSSRGLTLTFEKKTGRTTGWITYTLSKTDRRFTLINNGEGFPFDYDHRHDFKIVLLHRFSSRFDAGCTWLYHSGNFISFGNIMDEDKYIYIKRNAYELPAYHRLDINLNYHIKKRRLEHILTLSVYNVYNHKNFYNIEYFYNQLTTWSELPKNTPEYLVLGKTLFPVIPSLSYSINFF